MSYDPNTMSFNVPHTDMVYVSGLPAGVTEADVEELFGSIGIIKLDKKTKGKKIWLYRDKATGALKGDGTVTYDDPFSAGSAVSWFDGKEYKGVCFLRARAKSVLWRAARVVGGAEHQPSKTAAPWLALAHTHTHSHTHNAP
jgi:hypothetical protein